MDHRLRKEPRRGTLLVGWTRKTYNHTRKGVTASQGRGEGTKWVESVLGEEEQVVQRLVDPGLEVVAGTWRRRWLEVEGRPGLCQLPCSEPESRGP